MGNVDTKLNFRKAIVQLGTKDQVIFHFFFWSSVQKRHFHQQDNNKGYRFFCFNSHILISYHMNGIANRLIFVEICNAQ